MTEENALPGDIEAYLRGETPSAEALRTAGRLDGWTPAICRGPKGHDVMTLIGQVIQQPPHLDGKWVETTEIVWLDRKGRWARSRNELWKLGDPEGSMIPIDGVDL